MSSSKKKLVRNEWEMSTIERKYSVPPGGGAPVPGTPPLQAARGERGSTSEDLHAWSIYRQNLNSDFTDSALGSSEKSPLPYGNFQLRESTVHSIINHPRYGPKSALSSNMYTYLKFGLPRVFPPSRGRDGSSGYNSSDDGSPGPHKQRGPIRARSELDIRYLNANQHVAKAPHGPRNGRMSNSEANLLGMGSYHREAPRSRRSVVGVEHRYRPEIRTAEHRKSFHDLRSAAVQDTPFQRPLSDRRRASKAGSHMSLAHAPEMSRAHSVLGHTNPVAVPYYPSPPHVPPVFLYPHLQVRNMEIASRQSKDKLIVQGVSLEVRGGELLAVMTTHAREGSTILAAIAGHQSQHGGKVTGEFVVNGNLIERSQLRKRCAFVSNEGCWDVDLTVKQTLYFQHRLRRVKNKIVKLPLDDRISSLIEDLGLDQVADTKLSGVTQSELRRLSVAIHLLLDAQILLLDQPTKGMDIFDTFFLIEYLRQWALTPDITDGTGRIVMVSLQPPTYEILTMISRLLIVSNAHVMFSGPTTLLLPYFTSVEYPCPPFKNPSDYYLDLVTLDDLSAEAMLESSQRMTQLGELHRRRQSPLSDPGPPAPLPPPLHSVNPFSQASSLLLRNGIWSQPSSFIRYLFYILLAAVLSFLVGAIFWDVPGSDPQLFLEDRLGFHYTMFCVAMWPLLLLSGMGCVLRERKYVVGQVRQGLYSPAVYVITSVLSSLPGSLLMWFSYLIPSLIMSGLHFHGSNTESTVTFYQYMGLSLIYLHSLQLLALALGWLFRRTHLSVFFLALIVLYFSCFSGHPIHAGDVAGGAGRALRVTSPTWWLTSAILQREMDKDAFRNQNHVCKNKQRQRPEIIVQVACPKPNGTAELSYLDMGQGPMRLLPTHTQEALLVLCLMWLFSFILLLICFFIATRYRAPSIKPQRSTNKP